MSEPRISIIIPAYNAEKTIEQTLNSVCEQSYKQAYDIIAVDDGSKDQTASIVKSMDNVRYIYQENSGPAAARNNGFRHSRGEFIFFTDSDCVPERDWLSKMTKHFEDPTVAVVAGSYGISNDDKWLAHCIHKEIIFRHEKLMPSYPKYFGSFNFAIRRTVMKEVDGFDTSYRNASGEDNDLSYKVLKAGHKIYFEKDARVDHHHTSSVVKYLKEQHRHGFWRAKMYHDHPSMAKGDDYTSGKDIVEIPLSIMTMGLLVLWLFQVPFASISLLIILNFLVVLQLLFAFIIKLPLHFALLYSLVLLLRAYARSLGFILGFIKFLFIPTHKKVK